MNNATYTAINTALNNLRIDGNPAYEYFVAIRQAIPDMMDSAEFLALVESIEFVGELA